MGQKILIAIVTCHKNRARADAQRSTWVPEASARGLDVRFFLGQTPRREGAEHLDEVILNVDDGYLALPHKVRAMLAWALEHEYDYIFKTDDDTYINAERLALSGFEGRDYVGRLRGPSGGKRYPYASGFSYWLSNRAAAVVATTEPDDTAEDRYVGNTLYEAGFKCHPDYRYVVIKSEDNRNSLSGTEGPRRYNTIISAGELGPKDMLEVHRSFETRAEVFRQPEGPFSRVAVMVKTFLRDGMLYKALDGIQSCLPGAQIIVVDDGLESRKKIPLYSDLRRRGHICQWLPFDSGFCAKSNEAVRQLDREYMLIASDDFDFGPKSVREGVRRMMRVLDENPEIGVASGRVGNAPYEGFIERDDTVVTEVPLSDKNAQLEMTTDGVEFYRCDITVNYSLVRARVFESGVVKWDEEYKIGGDHFEFFEQVGRDWDIAFVPGVNINQQPYDAALVDPSYGKYRGRAIKALPRFFAKYGLTKYVCFGGGADVLLPDGRIARQEPGARPPGISPKKTSGMYVAEERLYITREGKVVKADDPRHKSLLVAKGCSMPLARARELGLL